MMKWNEMKVLLKEKSFKPWMIHTLQCFVKTFNYVKTFSWIQSSLSIFEVSSQEIQSPNTDIQLQSTSTVTELLPSFFKLRGVSHKEQIIQMCFNSCNAAQSVLPHFGWL